MKPSNNPEQSSSNIRKIAVAEVRHGMFISKLDCDWLSTPFLLQGFNVTTDQEILQLKQHCKFVWVDTAQSKTQLSANLGSSPNSQSTSKKHRYESKIPPQEEHVAARKIYDHSRRIAHDILQQAGTENTVNVSDAEAVVRGCVDSILRNHNALRWMSKIRKKDEYTAEHCLNVCILAIAFGRHLELDESQLYIVGLAGLLHDVGKMKVPPEVLNKPGKLTDKEFKIMAAHSSHGRKLLLRSKGLPGVVVEAAYSHHERIDGGGYPQKLSGEDYSSITKMISIVDTYDAITSNRCYANARSNTEALRIIYENRNTQFDEQLSLAFIQSIGLYPPGSIVELANGKVALVLAINHSTQHLPRIIVVRDANKHHIKPEFIDLSLTATGKVSNDNLIRTIHVDGSFGLHLRDFNVKELAFKVK